MKTEITIHTNTQKNKQRGERPQMHRYKPSKIPLFIFWAILAVILFLIRYAVNLIEKLIPFSVNYILMPLWIIAALFLPAGASLLLHQILFHRQLKRSHRLYRAFLYHAAFYAHLGNKIRHNYHNPTGQYNRT